MMPYHKNSDCTTQAALGKKPQLHGIHCREINAEVLLNDFSSEMYINAATILLITQGWVSHELNRHPSRVESGTVTVISASHRFRITDCSADVRGMCLVVGEEFMLEMDSTDMIYKRIRYGVKLYAQPVVSLNGEETLLIEVRLRELQRVIENTVHLYYKEVVLNRLLAFYLDLSDIIDRTYEFGKEEESTRHESIVKRFMELLSIHYRSEHLVEFYSSSLNISSHYLTHIVKSVTGHSASDAIYWMLYSDARAMLKNSKLSVQEISTLLNFSDQSSFGKFFKRRSGMSPFDYRRKSESKTRKKSKQKDSTQKDQQESAHD